MSRKEKTILVNECWCPSFRDAEGNQFVEVSIHKDAKANWRVAIWGNDDLGMEKPDLGVGEAYRLFHSIKDYTSMEDFTNLGFIGA